MATGLTYTRGRVSKDTAETGAVPRFPAQFPGFEGASLEEGTTNLVTNPSVELAFMDEWSTSGANTLERSQEQAKHGVYALKATYQNAAELMLYSITLTATTHTISMWFYIPIAYNGTDLRLDHSGFTGATGTSSAALNMSLRDEWQRVSLTFTPDSGALSGSFRLREYGTAPSSGRWVYGDAAQVEARAYATTYADGSLGLGYAWTSSDHASTSTRTQGQASLPDVNSVIAVAGGSVIVWWKPGHASSSGAGPVVSTLMHWSSASGSEIQCYYHRPGGTYSIYRGAGGAADSGANVSATFAAGAAQVAYFGWDTTVVEVGANGGALVTGANARQPALANTEVYAGVNASVYPVNNDTDGVISAMAFFNRRLSAAEWTYFANLARPPLLGERLGSGMTGLWYAGQRIVWTVPSSGASIDLNDVEGGDFRLISIYGAGTPPVLNRAVETPLRDGAAYIDSRLRPRMLAVTLLLQGPGGWSDIWRKRREVLNTLNPRAGRGTLAFAPDTQVYEIEAVVEGGLEFNNAVGPFAQQAALVMRCDDPAWRVAAANERDIRSVGGGMEVATSVPLSFKASGAAVTVTNEGDLPSFPQVRLTPVVADTQDPEIVNGARTFRLGDTYALNQEVTIDMDARTAVDGDGNNVIDKRTATSEIWALEPGENTVQVGQSGGAMVAHLRWWTRLLGV